GTRELLRIETVVTPPGGATLHSVIWTDRDGVIQKSRQMMDLTAYRTTREIALRDDPGPTFDIAAASVTPLSPRITQPEKLQSAQYRIELQEGNPAEVFVESSFQRVEFAGPNTAIVTVSAAWQIDGHLPTPIGPPGEPPAEADLAPNSQIQSDDPLIVQLAREAAADAEDPVALALNLERFVQQRVR